MDIQDAALHQTEMNFDEAPTNSRLMQAMDEINLKFGKGTLAIGSTGVTKQVHEYEWGMKQERRTPNYTTSWEDMPIARA